MTVLGQIGVIARIAWQVAPLRSIVALLVTVVQPLAGALLAVSLRAILDAAAHRDIEGVMIAAILAAAAQGGIALGWSVATVQRVLVNQRVGERIDRKVLLTIANTPTMDHLTDPKQLHDLELAQRGGQRMAAATWSVVTIGAALLQLVVTLALMSSVHPALAGMLVFVLPTLWSARTAVRHVLAGAAAAAIPDRAERALFDLAVEPTGWRETRNPRTAEFLRDRAAERHTEATGAAVTAEVRAAGAQAIGWAFFLIGWSSCLLLTCQLVLTGRATFGTLLLVATLAAQLRYNIVAVSSGLQGSAYGWAGLAAYQRIGAGRRTRSGGATPPGRLDDGIRLTAVDFAHQPGQEPVLRDINLHLPAGATVALVGAHGSGKTTLVDLLCGFRQPTSGQITIDGVPLQTLDSAAWRRRVVAAFQDYARFPFRVQHSVGVGDLPRVDDSAAVTAAIRAAGAAPVFDELPGGLGALLGTRFGDGRELSGGQWQRLALAKVFLRARPLLAVLDEPTAALDVHAEREVYTAYTEQARQNATAAGTVTLLVSHRFSTVQAADLIVMLDHGQVVEVGTHAELVSQDGRYAHLCRLQAASFRYPQLPYPTGHRTSCAS